MSVKMMWYPIVEDCSTCQCSSSVHDMCINKENMQLSPLKNDDLSLYGASPNSKARTALTSLSRRPLEDFDPNSQDCSGKFYWGDGNKFNEDAELLGVTPCDFSPRKTNSMDDDFLDFSEIDPRDENSCLPIVKQHPNDMISDFDVLLTGKLENCTKNRELSPISEHDSFTRPPFRRSISLDIDRTTPNSSRVRSCLFSPKSQDGRIFKRPGQPESWNMIRKKSKTDSYEAAVPTYTTPSFAPSTSRSEPQPLLQRSKSVTEESIKVALHRSSTEPDLIGDFTKSLCLPLVESRHLDLKSIAPKTLAELMRGKYLDSIEDFQIIDCRYPYEFEGGHIAGALNMYTKQQICQQLIEIKDGVQVAADLRLRHILIFHCEFSSERAPNLYRYLRNLDRMLNKESYPSLYYPEVYLLEGGYKKFYENYPIFCTPESYKPMLHPAHAEDLRRFRSKSKSFGAEPSRYCTAVRPFQFNNAEQNM